MSAEREVMVRDGQASCCIVITPSGVHLSAQVYPDADRERVSAAVDVQATSIEGARELAANACAVLRSIAMQACAGAEP